MAHLWEMIAEASATGNALHLPMHDDRARSITEILDRAERTAVDVLAQLRGRPPRRLGLVMANGEPWLRGLLTTLRLNATFVPLPLPVGFAGADGYIAQLRRIADVAALDGVLVDTTLGRALTARLRRDLDSTPILDVSEPGQRAARLEPVAEDDGLAVIQYTSGSTSAPKGVALTHRNVAAGLDIIARGFGWTKQDAFGLWVPLFHDMGLFSLLSGLAFGSSVYLWRPNDFARRPMRWLSSFARSAATVMPAPNFCFDQLVEAARREPPQDLDLTRWRLAPNGAEPVRQQTLEAFYQVFQPYGLREGTLSPGYGLAEATLLVTTMDLGTRWRTLAVDRDQLDVGQHVRRLARDDATARTVVGCGRVIPGLSLRIADHTGTPVREGTVGEIQLLGPSVTAGYLDLSAQLQPFTPDGWLKTGDLAFLDQGELFIVGRSKDMITVMGQNFYAEDIEELVRVTPGFGHTRTAAIACNSDDDERIVVLWETDLDATSARSMARTAREQVKQHLGLDAVAVVPVALATIPHTTSGKVRRQAALRLFLNDRELKGGQLTRREGGAR